MTDKLARHWTKNKQGIFTLTDCTGHEVGTLEHILLQCPALKQVRVKMVRLALDVAEVNPIIGDLIRTIFNSEDYTIVMQFLLDCSSIPDVILIKEKFGLDFLGPLLYISRNWCYSLHRERLTQLGLSKFR